MAEVMGIQNSINDEMQTKSNIDSDDSESWGDIWIEGVKEIKNRK